MFDTAEPTAGGADGRTLRDELRTHTTDWLRGERRTVVRAQQRLKARELAIVAVLDERGAASIPDVRWADATETVAPFHQEVASEYASSMYPRPEQSWNTT